MTRVRAGQLRNRGLVLSRENGSFCSSKGSGLGVQIFCYLTGTAGFIPGQQNVGSVNLATHLDLVSKLRSSGVLPPSCLYLQRLVLNEAQAQLELLIT